MPSVERTLADRLVTAAMWAALTLTVALVVAMTWHPWTIGERRGCPPGQSKSWDGWCRR